MQTITRARTDLSVLPDQAAKLFAGQITQLRFVISPQPDKAASATFDASSTGGWMFWDEAKEIAKSAHIHCPFGVVGDRIWIREKLQRGPDRVWEYAGDHAPVISKFGPYRALAHIEGPGPIAPGKMPPWACRTVLEILSVSMVSIHTISPRDAVEMGFGRFDVCRGAYFGFFPDGERRGGILEAYISHWVGKDPEIWTANPLMWALVVRREAP